MRCVCGCGRGGGQRHHVVYQQELRDIARARPIVGLVPLKDDVPSGPTFGLLKADPRNLVLVAKRCHEAHHQRVRPLPLHVLPDSVFEFAAEVLGPAAAYEYLRRRYAGGDPRLDALLELFEEPGRAA